MNAEINLEKLNLRLPLLYTIFCLPTDNRAVDKTRSRVNPRLELSANHLYQSAGPFLFFPQLASLPLGRSDSYYPPYSRLYAPEARLLRKIRQSRNRYPLA